MPHPPAVADAFAWACAHGYQAHVAEFDGWRGLKNLNYPAQRAVEQGLDALVAEYLRRGASADSVVVKAIESRNSHLISLCYKRGASAVVGAAAAAEMGDTELVKEMIARGARDLAPVFVAAASEGHGKIMWLCAASGRIGAEAIFTAAHCAACGGHSSTYSICEELMPNLEDALKGAEPQLAKPARPLAVLWACTRQTVEL